MRCANLLKFNGEEQLSEHKYWPSHDSYRNAVLTEEVSVHGVRGWCINLAKDDGRRKPKLVCFVGSLVGLCFYLNL